MPVTKCALPLWLICLLLNGCGARYVSEDVDGGSVQDSLATDGSQSDAGTLNPFTQCLAGYWWRASAPNCWLLENSDPKHSLHKFDDCKLVEILHFHVGGNVNSFSLYWSRKGRMMSHRLSYANGEWWLKEQILYYYPPAKSNFDKATYTRKFDDAKCDNNKLTWTYITYERLEKELIPVVEKFPKKHGSATDLIVTY